MRIPAAIGCLICLAWAGTLSAQVHDYPDCIGIYFDGEASRYCQDQVQGQLEAYLFLINPTDSTGIRGWECRIDIEVPEGNYFTGFELMGQSINAATEPEFSVGLGECLPFAKVVHLATLKMIALTPDPWQFYIRPITHASIEGRAAYAPCDDPSALTALQPVSGDYDEPVAWLNGPCDLDADKKVWDSVKSQYR